MPEINPMVIAIWCGVSKPTTLSEYFSSFVTELKRLLENGIVIGLYKIKILIRAFICDSPARSFIKGIKV